MATRGRKKKEVVQPAGQEVKWPKVTKGSHLTVTEYEDGRTELVWDDEALVRDVRQALESVK